MGAGSSSLSRQEETSLAFLTQHTGLQQEQVTHMSQSHILLGIQQEHITGGGVFHLLIFFYEVFIPLAQGPGILVLGCVIQ